MRRAAQYAGERAERQAKPGQGRLSSRPGQGSAADIPVSQHKAGATGAADAAAEFVGGGARTESLVMAYQTKQVRFVDTVHMFDRERPPAVRL